MGAERDDKQHHRRREQELPDLLPNGMTNAGGQGDAEGQALIADSVKRSTTDPLQVGLASATIADALQSEYTSSPARFWAWLIFVIPSIIVAAATEYIIWKPADPNVLVIDTRPAIVKAGELMFLLILSIVVWILPAYWIFVLRRRRQERRHSRK